MTVELSRTAYFNGEGLPAGTEVIRAKLDDTNDVYFLSPYDRAKEQEVPTVAMTVERLAAEQAGDTVRPLAEIVFESSEPIRPEHRAMLAQAAFGGADEQKVFIRDGNCDTAAVYLQTLGLEENFVPRRNTTMISGSEIEIVHSADSGTVAGYAANALRKTNISRARYLPNPPKES